MSAWKTTAIIGWALLIGFVGYVLIYPLAQMAFKHEQQINQIVGYINKQILEAEKQKAALVEKKDAPANK